MTIKGLKKLLKTKCPLVFKTLSMYRFKGSKIAIEVSGLAYSYWSPVQDNIIDAMKNPLLDIDMDKIISSWLNNMWSLLNKFLKLNITPVMVFDGKPPDEKKAVIEERQRKKKVSRDAIEVLKNKLESMDPFSRSPSDLNEIKKLYKSAGLLSAEHFSILKLFLNGLGLPVLQAKSEAEELCCTLCREGLVSAVYCDDSDCLAHLSPCWIFEKSAKKTYVKERSEYLEDFEFVLLDDVLQELNLTKDTFIDLCIMCGCDYNENVAQIAAGNSYKLLKEHENIEKVIDIYKTKNKNKDFTILKHEICRQRFAKRSYIECCELPPPVEKISIDKSCIETYSQDYLFKCNMSHLIPTIKYYYESFPDPIKLDFNVLLGKNSEKEQNKKVEEKSEVKVEKVDLFNLKIDMSMF